jgi:hypothetical protein
LGQEHPGRRRRTLIKSKDSAKEIARRPEKEARKKVEETGATFARQGQTSYTIADLSKPGRYVIVCFVPAGSISEETLEEAEKAHAKEHWREGMIATIRVERGASTTSAASSPKPSSIVSANRRAPDT